MDTISAYQARGGVIHRLPPAPAMGDLPLPLELRARKGVHSNAPNIRSEKVASSRYKAWQAMKAKGASFTAIGREYGVTARRVRKVLGRLAKGLHA